MCAFRVVALGDSLVWGQGLKHDTKFAVRAAKTLASRLGENTSYVLLLARAGAIMDPLLNQSPALKKKKAAQRATFADTYPEIFPGTELREKFIAGDESNAMQLYAEIPAPYPTVREQIRIAVGGADLVIISGGASELDFEAVLDPEQGLTPEEMDVRIKTAMYTHFKASLADVREKFPNAIIAAVSYYSPFSKLSPFEKVKQLAKDRSAAYFHVSKGLLYVPFLHIPFLLLAEYVDNKMNGITRDMIERSEFAFARTLYWQSVAVAELANDSSLRGPGILLVHSGFAASEAAFAGGASYTFEDYNPTKDPARDGRLSSYPRMEVAAKLSNLFAILRRISPLGDFSNEKLLANLLVYKEQLRQQLKALTDVRGPLALVKAMDDVLLQLPKATPALFSGPIMKSLYSEVRNELARIEIVRLASFLHPNEIGAKRYADRISDAVWATLNPDLNELVESLASKTKAAPRDKVLEAYGLNPAARPEELIQFSSIDSLAVKVETRGITKMMEKGVVQPTLNSVWLRTESSAKEWELKTLLTGDKRAFAPGAENLFTFDTFGGLELQELAGLSLEVDGHGWQPGRFELIVNGQRLFEIDLETMGPWLNHGTRRTLPYPKLWSGGVTIVREHT